MNSKDTNYKAKMNVAADAIVADDREQLRASLGSMEHDADCVVMLLWQAWAAESVQDKQDALQKVIELDPRNEVAWAGLTWLDGIQESAELQLELKLQAEDFARVEEESRLAEEAAQAEAKEEARVQAKAEEEARVQAEAEEEARVQAEAEEIARVHAEAEEAARVQAEEEARVQAEEEARLQAEVQAKAEEERLRAKEEAQAKIDEARVQAELAARAVAEKARIQAEQEAIAIAEEDELAESDVEAQVRGEQESTVLDDVILADPAEEAASEFSHQAEADEVVECEIVEAEIKATVDSIAEEVRQEIVSDENSGSPVGTNDSADQETQTDSKKFVILAVDDSPTIRKLVSLALTSQGYEVITAEDGSEALFVLGNQLPDLILSDINMPKLGGYKLCRFVKKHDRTKNIPVIMLSGKDGVFDKMRGKLCGCDDFIGKPFESAELIEKVREHLNAQPSKI